MANLLGAEPSAYLRSASHQPVHWQPWGEPAFTRARAEDKPVLLDIGAVWCHWCHVMDGESYEDAAIAEILNREFVCVKVDRDERPDVDARYQRAVQALAGQGGWPLTAFLTPDGDVFFGGTYFPPEPNPYHRPGFRSVLLHLVGLWREDRDKLLGNARAVREHLSELLNESKTGAVTAALLEAGANQLARAFDIRFGGFGGAPKFPHPAACEFLIGRWYDTREDWPREIVEKTLLAMARGGIRDHLGGGFHRYAVDERWIVPHFEKMSYDNAALLRAYSAAGAAWGDPRFRDVAQEIVRWVLEVLTDPARGEFAASQDADVGLGDDGDYWTWTLDEARSLLDARELELVRTTFDIGPRGEMHHNPAKNVLWRASEPAPADLPALRNAMTKLKAARDARPAPFVDRTPYVSWNAMLAGALLRAGAVLDRPDCNTIALRVLDRIWRQAWDESRGMAHVIGRPEPRGMLDDAVQAAAAFLDAYEATGDPPWLERSAQVMRYGTEAHWDEAVGGYFDLASDRRGEGATYLATPAKPVQDAPTPSPNGVAALVLARLAALTGDPAWRSLLDRQLAAFAGVAADLSLHGATILRALDWALQPVTRIDVPGPRGDGPACAMHLLALRAYRPRKVVVRREAPAPAATVCVGTTCSLPVGSPAALEALLATR